MDRSALDDIRVLDISGEIGLYCGKLLADLGADVIKVEPLSGHPGRYAAPFYHDQLDPEKSLTFYYLATSQRSVTLDLEQASGIELFRRLAATADVVIESSLPGHLDSMGIGYEELSRVRPDIILTSITGFGQWGPHSLYKAPDIVGVAMSGVMWLAGEADDPPNRPYGNQGYISASIQAACGTLMALYHRDLTGEGQQVDVSMQEALSLAQETAMQSWDMKRIMRRRIGAWRVPTMPVPGVGCYECSDGYVYCYVGTPGGAPWPDLLAWMLENGFGKDLMGEPYRSMIQILGLPFITELLVDPERAEREAPVLDRIDDELKAFLRSKTKVEAYEQAQERRILVGIVSTPKDLIEDRQLVYRHWLQEVEHPELGETLHCPGPPVRLSETPMRPRWRAPLIGEHSREVYGELGLSEEEMDGLMEAGVI